jgi:hypothetical protein
MTITNNQLPAFAEAASRRQANNQIITNIQISIKEIVWLLGHWNLFGSCLPAGRQGIWLLEFLPILLRDIDDIKRRGGVG